MGRVEESIMKHKAEIQIAKKSGIDEIKIRAMDNLAVRLLNWDASSRWSSSLYCLMLNSDELTNEMMHPTLIFYLISQLEQYRSHSDNFQ